MSAVIRKFEIVRDETRKCTMNDLKALAIARCIELYRGMDSEGLYHAGPLVQALAEIGRDACTPYEPKNKNSRGLAAAGKT